MSVSNLPTVIIPVFNAVTQLQQCLESLHRTLSPGCQVIVIDDASDDARIQTLLQYWSNHAGPDWRFVRQTNNMGFVGSVNRGMNMTRNDVVLLNSDTVLSPGWLEGMQRCLASDPSIATATPWTNNGEIVSLPNFCQSNPLPDDLEGIARVISSAGTPLYPEIPTAVGFCMAISRNALDTLGLFDQDLFGLGYGEENDFSMKARNAGMKNVLCDDVYVAHIGGSSFLPRGLKPDEVAMEKLLSRHPRYLELIEAFIAADPLRQRREALVSQLHLAGINLGSTQ